MAKERRRGKLLAVLLLSAVLVSAGKLSVYARQEDKCFIILGCDSEGTPKAASMAYVVKEDSGNFVIADSGAYGGSELTYSIYSVSDPGKPYNVEWLGELSAEYRLTVFAFSDDIPPVSQIMEEAACTKGQTVDLVYYIPSEKRVSSCEILLEDASEDAKGHVMLDASITDGETDLSLVELPAVLIDQDERIVGLITGSIDIFSFMASADPFYEDAASRQEETNQEQTSAEEKEEPQSKKAERKETRPESLFQPDIGSKSRGSELIEDAVKGGIIGVIAAALAGGVGYLIAKRKKKKQVDSEKDDQSSRQQDQKIIPPVAGGDDSDRTKPYEEIASYEKKKDEKPPVIWPQTRSASIMGISGPLGNMLFPIGESEAIMGRGVSAAIRFPPDAREISQVHCKLFWSGSGMLMLADCNSMNGTYLKGYGRLMEGHPVELKKGSVFCLASDKNTFVVQ